MFLNIYQSSNSIYPDNVDNYSPNIKYPESPFSAISSFPNPVYSAVRETLRQAGLDEANFGTPLWNPLGCFIPRNANVFLLCNFVYHRRPSESPAEFYAKCTHGSVIRALIDYVYIATGPEGTISFGNAPLQSCDFSKVLHDTGADILPEFYRTHGVHVTPRDLRIVSRQRGIMGNTLAAEIRSERDLCFIPLDEFSLLDELYEDGKVTHFRVTDYNPDRIEQFHQFHRHTYLIHRDILGADVVLSVPKLKTHEKVGLTVGLKGLVGIVGHRDCLAHHRFGPPSLNGDEYPDNGRYQIWASGFHDFVQRSQYPKWLGPALQILDKSVGRILRKGLKKTVAGAWSGNDTAWRMTLDLANIIHHADKEGIMRESCQRTNLVFIDGIIAGEGDGPLAPGPVRSGCLVFSDNLLAGDLAACRLMGWDFERIPLLQRALGLHYFNLSGPAERIPCLYNGMITSLDFVPPAAGRKFIPAAGWKNRLL